MVSLQYKREEVFESNLGLTSQTAPNISPYTVLPDKHIQLISCQAYVKLYYLVFLIDAYPFFLSYIVIIKSQLQRIYLINIFKHIFSIKCMLPQTNLRPNGEHIEIDEYSFSGQRQVDMIYYQKFYHDSCINFDES